MTEYTQKDVEAKLAALGDSVSCHVKGVVVCEMIGHSNILIGDFGRFYCGRCDEYLGDSLGGAYRNENAVIVDHDCEYCRENAKRLTWKDTLMAPDPHVTATAD